MIARLADDHVNARRLAEGLAAISGVRSPGDIAQPGADDRLDPERVTTNFVLFRVAADRAAFIGAARERGVLLEAYPHGQVRAATHFGVTATDVDRVIEVVEASLAETAGRIVAVAS
jgi:threonine aldolase